MSLPLDGLGGLLLAVGAAVVLYLAVLTLLIVRRRRRRRRLLAPKARTPGWYADPKEPQLMRFWDGAKWTDSPAD